MLYAKGQNLVNVKDSNSYLMHVPQVGSQIMLEVKNPLVNGL